MIDPISTSDLQEICGISTSTVPSLRNRGIFVLQSTGSEYLWAPISLKNYIAYLKKRHGTGDANGETLANPEDEYRRQKARIEKMKADQLQEKLIEVVEVEHQWESHVFATKAKLLALPGKLASGLAPFLKREEDRGKVMALADDLVRETLEEMTKELAEDEDDDEADELNVD